MKRTKLTPKQRLSLIRQIIDIVENRSMAVDGPVSKTNEEITNQELRRIYKLTDCSK